MQQPLFLTGEGNILIKRNCTFGYLNGGFNFGGSINIDVRSEKSEVIINENVFFNNNVNISSCNFIEIGKNTLVGQNVNIMDYDAHGINPNMRNKIGKIGSIKIGNNVWIGTNVIILKNTVIGDNCIIAAGAVVSGFYQENLIIGGVPSKIIKTIQFEKS
ncbi:MAG: acyltransferase [Bacteroidia bacterium]